MRFYVSFYRRFTGPLRGEVALDGSMYGGSIRLSPVFALDVKRGTLTTMYTTHHAVEVLFPVEFTVAQAVCTSRESTRSLRQLIIDTCVRTKALLVVVVEFEPVVCVSVLICARQ